VGTLGIMVAESYDGEINANFVEFRLF